MPAGNRISGKSGTIKLAASGGVTAAIFQLSNWTITRSAVVHKEATNSTAGFKGATAGTKDWSLTFEQYLDDANAIPVVEGSAYDVELDIDGTATNYYSGTVVIEEIAGPEVDINDGATMMITVTAQGDGAYTINGTI